MELDNWELDLNYTFVLYLFTAILSFGAACFLVDAAYEKTGNSLLTKTAEYTRVLEPMEYPVLFTALLSVACTAVYIYLMLKRVDTSHGLTTTLRNIYEYIVNGSTSDFVLHQFLEVVVALAKINVFAMFYQKYVNRERMKIGYLVPVVCYMFCMVISTDRNIFLRFVLYTLCLWIFFYSYYSKKEIEATNRKVFFQTAFYIAILAVVFFALGKMKNYTSNLKRMLSIYAGSGLYNFNLFLKNHSSTSLKMGQSTFSELLNTLKAFGLFGGNANTVAEHGKFITFTARNGYVYSSNIYSAMRPYAEDFGYLGMIIYPFFLGAFYEVLYIKAKTAKAGFKWILYALLMYSIVYFPIAEQFFWRFHLGLVYEIGWVTVFYLLFFNDNRIRAF